MGAEGANGAAIGAGEVYFFSASNVMFTPALHLSFYSSVPGVRAIAIFFWRSGLRSYYRAKIEELELQCRDKQLNLRRLEAQRNDYNTKGKR